ncbi:hypothetical protein Tco_0930352 [Tanacetum coccineum]
MNIFKLFCSHGRWAIPLDKGLFEEILDEGRGGSMEMERVTGWCGSGGEEVAVAVVPWSGSRGGGAAKMVVGQRWGNGNRGYDGGGSGVGR